MGVEKKKEKRKNKPKTGATRAQTSWASLVTREEVLKGIGEKVLVFTSFKNGMACSANENVDLCLVNIQG